MGEMARLERPLKVFGGLAGRGLSHPDQDLVGVGGRKNGVVVPEGERKRRPPGEGIMLGEGMILGVDTPTTDDGSVPVKKRVRVRFAESGDEGKE